MLGSTIPPLSERRGWGCRGFYYRATSSIIVCCIHLQGKAYHNGSTAAVIQSQTGRLRRRADTAQRMAKLQPQTLKILRELRSHMTTVSDVIPGQEDIEQRHVVKKQPYISHYDCVYSSS